MDLNRGLPGLGCLRLPAVIGARLPAADLLQRLLLPCPVLPQLRGQAGPCLQVLGLRFLCPGQCGGVCLTGLMPAGREPVPCLRETVPDLPGRIPGVMSGGVPGPLAPGHAREPLVRALHVRAPGLAGSVLGVRDRLTARVDDDQQDEEFHEVSRRSWTRCRHRYGPRRGYRSAPGTRRSPRPGTRREQPRRRTSAWMRCSSGAGRG